MNHEGFQKERASHPFALAGTPGLSLALSLNLEAPPRRRAAVTVST
jgi:hypothetical protein